MELLSAAALAFIATHLGVSSTPLRGKLVTALGEGPYLGLYSLVAAITLGLMIYAYAGVPHHDYLWHPSAALHATAKVLMVVASVLLMMGLLSRNPTAVGMASAVKGDLAGIFRITRHPVQWAFLLWAAAHILANGDVATLILAGSIALVSGLGMFAMDARRRRSDDPDWEAFYRSTSATPFVALVTGKASLSLRDINWVGLGAGLALYAAFYFLHGWIAGVPLV